MFDIAAGKLSIAQNKTGKKLRISIEGDLADVVKRIMDKPRNAKIRLCCKTLAASG